MLGITDPWVYVSAATGLALALVGVYVARVGKGERQNRAFGYYAAGFGLVAAVSNLTDFAAGTIPDGWLIATHVLQVALALMGTAGLVVLVLTYPTPFDRADRRVLWFPSATLAALLGLTVVINVLVWRLGLFATLPASTRATALAASVTFDVLRSVMMASGVLLALRFRRTAAEAHDHRSSIALVAVAVFLYPSAFGMWVAGAQEDVGLLVTGLVAVLTVGATALLCTLWLWNTRLPEGGHLARNVALLICVAPFIGVAYRALELPFSVSWLMRTLEVLLIAYAILRYQLLGIDVKVRWGISKGTIAATFFAAFFVVSELAKEFFADQAQSQLIGVVAAGALLFAISPLQRVADRLAEKAVPVAHAVAPVARSHEAAYRRALRLALRDRRFTREEEAELFDLATELGIDAGTAFRLRHEVERDLEKGGSA